MDFSLILRRLKTSSSYYISVGIFIILVIGIVSSLYYSALKIDYVWRWYRIPQYFVYQDQVEIRAEIEGEVESILLEDNKATIRVKSDGEAESYTVPDIDIRVDEGDLISPGDILATYKKWRIGILMQGLWLTLKVSIIAIVFGILIGLFAGIARISSNPAFKWSAITYIEFIRGSPLLVQIFIWYFVLGTLINNILVRQGIGQIPALWFGVAALACFAGAYVAEMVRAGIQSIHFGQIEAAKSLGMTYVQSMRYIILPQALRRILPPLAGQFISLIKDSSLLGLIAIRELTKATREVITTSLQPFELWFVCAILYLILTFSLSMFVQYLERRTEVT
ncbi:MAG: ABC transporter permease subunit [Desulfobacteraceae bacterium]|nr:ABC transporter permease subunit [Desulfobacteraceae bacterium]MDH3572207.1 ABC transporter permease subunit [Desulfobacteraceae bacterium]MDH3720046.1 ABC transporter permease subunit [Desulfobacteraceae bacterium]MDH3835993.1 ABC transporter permease subunit [Desulfobacteraceae bacterium]MDH3872742.1 ABC transporter permease subunit [Desulfobacteraceae bacterium]